jgi:hypothetical protein
MTTPLRQQLINQMRLMLGDQMIDVELDPEHYETALDLSFDRYRQRAGSAMEEAYMFLKILYEQNEYYLPDEVVMVRQVFRRGMGNSNGGTSIDPFSLAYTNLYLLQAGAGGGYSAGLLTYELFNDYLKQAGKMFGAYMNFTFDPVTKKLQLIRKPTGGESVVLWVGKVKSDDHILQDPFIKPWIRSYAYAWCKIMLGQAYSKSSQLIGPQGGTTLKGPALISEGKEEIVTLEKELDTYVDGSFVPGIVIG